jgi:FtsP/CotA-like multicopper oxidase with cupredoxin domain
MAVRDVYLKIEQILDYSPVDPDPASPVPYRRDCMRNPGHEDATIPASEVNARKLTALVYREYLDPNYLVPKPDKIVSADINEPAYHRRIPGTVIYARPGDRLRIHVFNGDVMPHTLHMHGLSYGIDSDGAWPLGTQASDGRRSDEICPGDSWTYTFDVRDEMVGAWPFHDHWRHVGDDVNRGLFGGVIVLPRRLGPPPGFSFPPELKETIDMLMKRPPRHVVRPPGPPPTGPLTHTMDPTGHRIAGAPRRPGGLGPAQPDPHARVPREGAFDLHPFLEVLEHLVHVPHHHPVPRPPAVLHVPLFYHFLSGPRGAPAFDSGDLANGQQFTQVFAVAGTFDYFCQRHGAGMSGTVNVQPGGANQENVTIVDNQFNPASVTVRPGGTVVWTHAGQDLHTVTEQGRASLPTYCFNGRAFVGNTPTIEAQAGQRVRWYVFNLDLGMNWHNFHPHSQRWSFANETIDGRSLGPAESFIVDTVAPPVLLREERKPRPRRATRYDLRGDFLFHCHVEMHMMLGMAGLVRSRQSLWLTAAEVAEIESETGLPIDPGGNACPAIDLGRCETMDAGRWEEVAGNPEVTMMHSALLPQTTRVLFWGYTRVDQSRLWDYGPGGAYSTPANQPADAAPAGTPNPESFTDLWSAGHAFLDTPEGTLLAHGGFSGNGYTQALLFDPATNLWSLTDATADGRFYATTLTLGDGTLVTLYGSPPAAVASASAEIYSPGAGWGAPIALDPAWGYLFYPWTFLLPGGDLFIAGPTGDTRRFALTPAVTLTGSWFAPPGNRSTGGEKGTAVLLPLRPPNYEPRALIAGGNTPGAAQDAQVIDLSQAAPAWQALPNLNVGRPEQVNTVLLPDGRVFLAGGVPGAGGPTEIFDPEDPMAGWLLGPSMTYTRGYHSSALLLADGSVLMGGDPAGPMGPTPHERYYPGYFSRPRPALTGAPATINYGASFTIQTPDAPAIDDVVLIRPGAVTHGFNMSQRFVGCAITGSTGSTVDATAPPDGHVAPPGWYLLFVVSSGRVPSEGRWLRLTP